MGIGAFQGITYGTSTMKPRAGTLAELEADAEAARKTTEAREAHKMKLNEVAVIATGRDGDYVAGKGEAGGHTGFSGSTKAEQKVVEVSPKIQFKQEELGEPPVVKEVSRRWWSYSIFMPTQVPWPGGGRKGGQGWPGLARVVMVA